jgi:hypothetical protein
MYNTFGRILLQQKLSSTETAIVNFMADVLATLYLTNPVIGFYIYTLTGPKFRAEFKRCTRYGLKIILTLICENPVMNAHRRENNVRPIQQQQPVVMTTAV